VKRIDPYPRCECGKVIFLHQERAAFYAVQSAVFYGVPSLPYQCRMQDKFWHIGTVHLRGDIRRWKQETEGRHAKSKRSRGRSDF
jgi:hypothetical protein